MRAASVAVALVAGVLLADRARPGAVLCAIAGTLAIVLLAAAWWLHRRNRNDRPGEILARLSGRTLAFLLAGALLAGFSDLGFRMASADESPLARMGGRVVEIGGRITSDAARRGPASRFALKTRTADGSPVRGRLSVTLYGPLPHLEPGDEVFFTAKMARLDLSESFDRYLYRRGAMAKASGSAAGLRVLGKDTVPLMEAANALRRQITRAVGASLPGGRGGLLLGLLIGDEGRIPAVTIGNFRAAGLSHLTAVSGANVAMVLAPLLLLLTAAGLGRRARIVVGISAVVIFVMVTRWEPSVLRACVMASLALAAFLFGRKAEPRHVLGLSFIGLTVVDPFILWSAGFQLSFAATAGIIFLAPLIYRKLRLGGGEEGKKPRPLLQALAVGVAAQLAVMPLLVWHFERFSLVSVPANLAAFPLVAPATVLGMTGGLVSAVSEAAGKVLIQASGVFVWALEGVGRLFGGSAKAQLEVVDWSAAHVLAAYLAMIALFFALGGRIRRARWPAAVAAAVFVASGLAPAARAARPSGMRLTFFDVGQGDAALIESQGGARMLIDGGPEPDLLVRRLEQRGVERLDLVIASHAHADHVSGLAAVVDRLHVRRFLGPGVDDPLVDLLFGKRRPRAVGEGDLFQVGDVQVKILAPGRAALEEAREAAEEPAQNKEGSTVNDASVVARISLGRGCALFPGDLEEEGQETLAVSAGRSLHCSVLKAPHHGSAKLLASFVQAVAPEIVSVSSGPNRFGHPTSKALSIFERSGARTLRTDLLGDIVLEIDASGRVEVD